MEGSIWFRRFRRECERMSPHIRFKRIKYGFYRIYWVGGGEPAYIHEAYKEMPYKGYDFDEDDFRLEQLSLYEQYEDRAALTRKLKNFVEGYIDSIRKMERRIYMLKNDAEFRKEATKAYRTIRVK